MLLLLALNGFFKTILIIVLVYVALRFLIRLLLPYIMRYVAKKAGEKMGHAFKGFSDAQKPNRPEPQPVEKKSKEVVGEYIDFEEID
ncbi:DUF4834 domain-containing protein [uncultured Dokdonia sp.]|uniref:DUF4834 domain-containing protein n=1 Tax=uncultured Dokdonia sp. TaxID=575653 RepID=UPI002626A48D|nr:DUF4834 domain-containing protein [uncultured Dokdonia sp.]